MKTVLLRIMLSLTLTGVVACNNKVRCNCSRDNVCVVIANATGKRIKEVKLLTNIVPVVESEQLEPNGKTCLSFSSPGENSFSLIAILDNGSSVVSEEQYSEGGYKFRATIMTGYIKVEFDETY